ncbi:hypothetical protein Naga_102331g1 [Nannochloropsis gaditana]|uniref:Uncharacterized protein n=1 Tax=Nannochloropsis gaditana TaxID=72520 RepID=W7T954_9STRA|nr:hypothetical protein Naga_102331g1 [Nannochloropsis gaditana]
MPTSITRLSGVHCKDRRLCSLCHGDFGTILVVIWCFGQAALGSPGRSRAYKICLKRCRGSDWKGRRWWTGPD